MGSRRELELHAELCRRHLTCCREIDVVAGVRRQVDLVLPRERIAVFVDGCYWHGCPIHGRTPLRGGAYWLSVLDHNMLRDIETTQLLQAAGWQVIRIWEHESLLEAADKIEAIVSRSH